MFPLLLFSLVVSLRLNAKGLNFNALSRYCDNISIDIPDCVNQKDITSLLRAKHINLRKLKQDGDFSKNLCFCIDGNYFIHLKFKA